jgi:hypothetical protein
MQMSERIDALLKERGKMYGEAVDNFTAVGRGWGAILNIEDIPPYQVALMMDFLKTIRCAINPMHEDSWQDKAGYSELGKRIALDES